MNDNKKDLTHFLKLAAAQVRHRQKTTEPANTATSRYLNLLEDLIKEQGQTDEDARHSTRSPR